MSSSPSPSPDFSDIAVERNAELRQELKRKLRFGLLAEVLLADPVALLDTAIGVDRTALVVSILRELADELERRPL